MKYVKWLLLFFSSICNASDAITLFVPYGPGGATDHLARVTANIIETKLSLNVVIINKPGASSNIGFTAFLECQKNCLLIAGPNIKTNQKYVSESYPKEIAKIPPLAFLTETPQVLYVRKSLNVDSFMKLRENKNLVFGHGGRGTLGYKSFEKICTYFECQEVPYKSGSAAIIDLLGQRLDVITIPAYGAEVISNEKAIPILVLGKRRIKDLSVPSAEELGYKNLIVESWWMLFERNMTYKYKTAIAELFKSDVDFIKLWNNNE